MTSAVKGPTSICVRAQAFRGARTNSRYGCSEGVLCGHAGEASLCTEQRRLRLRLRLRPWRCMGPAGAPGRPAGGNHHGALGGGTAGRGDQGSRRRQLRRLRHQQELRKI